ncbi:glycosyltransferase [Sporosarcina sp. E16_3]|uniref:glycosyltransferase n=1 Tax=Sporosarcina sp. E16_3 TaxID=2789293 RepID=UPI001A90EE6E|nr:glycosyltransferase [Sporosarcina sp. E16_3]MBO0602544.1 glycosyltransferase [Sporosarcina sp. E16_3]
MKVCILSPVHPYLDVRVYQKEALTLSKHGYEIIIVAQSLVNMEIGNIKILKAPEYNNRFKRFLTQPLLLFKALKINAGVYHIHNPDMLPIGFILRTMRKKVIYDTHEDFSKRIFMREWIPLLLRKLIAGLVNALEKAASKYFNAIVVTQPQMVSKFGGKSHLIENAPILHSELTDKAYKLSENIVKGDNIIRLIYVGGISKARGIREIINALEVLNKTRPFRLWLIGPCFDDGFIDELKGMAGWVYVDYLGYLLQEEAFAHMIQSDIGLVTILDVGDHSTTSPNKLFEYQRFGLPFVSSNFPKWIEQVSETNSGIFVDPLEINEVAASLLRLAENPRLRIEMGKNGQQYIFQKFNWDIESKKLLDLYDSIK